MSETQLGYHPNVEVFDLEHKGFKGLRASKAFVAGDVIFEFIGDRLSPEDATDFALQIDTAEFLESDANHFYENFLNHSHNPNCKVIIDEQGRVLLVAKSETICVGDELTFNYNTTELWFLRSGFLCSCNENCATFTAGFIGLSRAEQQQLYEEGDLLPYLRAMYELLCLMDEEN